MPLEILHVGYVCVSSCVREDMCLWRLKADAKCFNLSPVLVTEARSLGESKFCLFNSSLPSKCWDAR